MRKFMKLLYYVITVILYALSIAGSILIQAGKISDINEILITIILIIICLIIGTMVLSKNMK